MHIYSAFGLQKILKEYEKTYEIFYELKKIISLYYIAAGQNFESDDGLQKAIKRLQSAAGIFAHLKETSVGAIQRDPTPDLDPDTLGILAGNFEITDFFNVIIREMGKELIFKK